MSLAPRRALDETGRDGKKRLKQRLQANLQDGLACPPAKRADKAFAAAGAASVVVDGWLVFQIGPCSYIRRRT